MKLSNSHLMSCHSGGAFRIYALAGLVLGILLVLTLAIANPSTVSAQPPGHISNLMCDEEYSDLPDSISDLVGLLCDEYRGRPNNIRSEESIGELQPDGSIIRYIGGHGGVHCQGRTGCPEGGYKTDYNSPVSSVRVWAPVVESKNPPGVPSILTFDPGPSSLYTYVIPTEHHDGELGDDATIITKITRVD